MDLEGLVAEARERRPQPMPAHERAVAAGMAVAYLLSAGIVGAIVAPHDRPLHLGNVVALVLLTALTMRAQFEIGSGVASPAALATTMIISRHRCALPRYRSAAARRALMNWRWGSFSHGSNTRSFRKPSTTFLFCIKFETK